LLLDLHMPGISGRQLQEMLAQHDRSPRVIFMTGNGDLAAGIEAMKAGAEDFLEKPIDADVLLAAVARAVERHEIKRQQSLLNEQWNERVMRLSVREREIMAQVIKGRLNKQIAADLFIAEQTVKQHRGRVMEKMGVRSVAELVRACEITGFSQESVLRPVDAKDGA
jgi:FixJ family two-component response regulator